MNNHKRIKTFKFILLPIGIFLYGNFASAEALNLPKDSEGWTIFTPSADSDVRYVDSVSGNDATCRSYRISDPEMGSDPFHPAGTILPCKTVEIAVAKSAGIDDPDWLLIKRGSEFSGGLYYYRSGRSATEPAVIAPYGDSGDMPVFHGGFANNGNYKTNYLALSGMDFYNDVRDPNSPNYQATGGASGGCFIFENSESRSISGLLIEGCRFRFFLLNMQIAPGAESGSSGVTIRRNLIADAYSRNSEGHSQGMLLGNIDGLLMEENIFDHNGWLVQNDSDGLEESGEATIFNHNSYISHCNNATIRNNIFMRSSSINSKIRLSDPGEGVGLLIDNNLYVGGEIAVQAGANDVANDDYSVVDPIITNNVFTNAGYPNPTNREVAWFFYNFNWDGGEISNNLMIHQANPLYTNSYFYYNGESGRNIDVHNNILYDVKNATPLQLDNNLLAGMTFSNNIFDVENAYIVYANNLASTNGFSFSNNKYHSTKAENTWFRLASANKTNAQWVEETGDNSTFERVAFTDPTRSVESYLNSIGEENNTLDGFIALVRNQGRYNWDTRITASVVNSYIKAGFVSADIISPSAPMGLSVL